MSMACRRCRTSPGQPDVVGCGREVAKWFKKITSVPKTKKEDELPVKLIDDLKNLIARRNP
jgi:murein endopeptidase